MKNKSANLVLVFAVVFTSFQLWWFGPKCIREIDYDGMAYTGIARHLRHGEFYAAINAFRSPLLSWIIAVIPGSNLVLIGKVVNIFSLLLCGVLSYVFTMRLWNSKLAASIAVALFAFGRGFVPGAAGSVVPDFLFAALTLVYFLLLLQCLRGAGWVRWFSLGIVHGIAYLAKAFALPWLALSSLAAALLSVGTIKQRVTRLASAALVPVVAAGAWALVLHSKYGVYTTGTQFKTNLLQWTLKAYRDHRDPTYLVLRDTTKEVDEYVIDDPMAPGSWPWNYHVSVRHALPKVLSAELRNVPQVIKEILIVVTPGGLLAFAFAVGILGARRRQFPVEWRVVIVIVVSAISLVCTYSMLVFDARYLYPLIPLLLAVAARFLVRDDDWNYGSWRMMAIALVVLGEIAALAYSSSPFRMRTRDFQLSCYDAGNRLKTHRGATLASIGAGPFPEHGVGWEAGYKAAFFGGRRIIAATDDLPSPEMTGAVLADLAKAAPDSIIVWRSGNNPRYVSFVQSLAHEYHAASSEEISDPVLGVVGTILFINKLKAVNSSSTEFGSQPVSPEQLTR